MFLYLEPSMFPNSMILYHLFQFKQLNFFLLQYVISQNLLLRKLASNEDVGAGHCWGASLHYFLSPHHVLQWNQTGLCISGVYELIVRIFLFDIYIKCVRHGSRILLNFFKSFIYLNDESRTILPQIPHQSSLLSVPPLFHNNLLQMIQTHNKNDPYDYVKHR